MLRTPLLTLDIAKAATGWAAWSPGTPPEYGTERFGRYSDLGAMLCAYSAWLGDLLRARGVQTVVFEAPYVRHPNTAEALYNLTGTTEQVCKMRSIACYSEHVGTVRKHFIGNGGLRRDRAKARVIEECRARGWEPPDDNAADALALLDHQAHVWKLKPDWPCGALFEAAG